MTTGSMVAIGAAIVLAGATIAPTVSSIYAMVDAAAPAGTQTEAFSWLLTASLTGAALGAAVAGALVQSASAPAAFAFVGGAGGITALVAVLGSRSLTNALPERVHPPSPAPVARLRTQQPSSAAGPTQIRTPASA